jgi:adenylyl-sulfate kinase
MLIWMTGLSGSGKTTIAKALIAKLMPSLPTLVLIDGDSIRDLFGNDLGFDLESRLIQIMRIQRIAKFLTDQEVAVIVAALYSNTEILEFNRRTFESYFEVYVHAPMQILENRDTKGIYSKARSGDQINVVGIDIPWTPPQNPDVIARTDRTSVDEIVAEIIRSCPDLPKSVKKFSDGIQK